MAGAARLGDSMIGMAGEHADHKERPHNPAAISGTIAYNCSSNVFINGRAAASVGSGTAEGCSCCGSGIGTVITGSGKVFINGRPAARNGDAVAPHAGTGNITSGSSNVIIA